MQKPFKKVALFAKRTNPSLMPLTKLYSILKNSGKEILLEASTARALGLPPEEGLSIETIGKQADLAIVFGGDGTMLGIARQLSLYGTPMIGINAGRLGFITDLAVDNMASLVPQILEGHYKSDHRMLLEGTVKRGKKIIYKNLAFNDITVSRGISGGMIEFTVRVNELPMASQRADGLIISTPTGSTAYALSSGGPILYPTVGGILLVPVAPHTLSNRPIVLPDTAKIEIEITDIRDACLYFDMQDFQDIMRHDELCITRSDCSVTLLHPLGYNHFETLRKKLQWNYMPSLSQDR